MPSHAANEVSFGLVIHLFSADMGQQTIIEILPRNDRESTLLSPSSIHVLPNEGQTGILVGSDVEIDGGVSHHFDHLLDLL